MTDNIVEFSKFRPCRLATGPNTLQGVRLPDDELTEAELGELCVMFAPGLTRKALISEAAEQAYIEAHNGPIDLRDMPNVKLLSPAELRTQDAAIKVQQLKLMIDRTAQLLREYLAAYRSLP